MRLKKVSYVVDVYRATSGASSASAGTRKVGEETKTGYLCVDEHDIPIDDGNGGFPVFTPLDVIVLSQIEEQMKCN